MGSLRKVGSWQRGRSSQLIVRGPQQSKLANRCSHSDGRQNRNGDQPPERTTLSHDCLRPRFGEWLKLEFYQWLRLSYDQRLSSHDPRRRFLLDGWLTPALGQLGRQREDVRLLSIQRDCFRKRGLGIAEPAFGKRRARLSKTPLDHTLSDPHLERGMTFR